MFGGDHEDISAMFEQIRNEQVRRGTKAGERIGRHELMNETPVNPDYSPAIFHRIFGTGRARKLPPP